MSTWKDSLNIVKHLSIRRIWNLVLLKISFWVTRISSRSIFFGQPFSLSIEPTTACNLGCPECPSGLKQFTRPTGKLNLKLHEEILKQVKNSVFYINYYFQGEPFLHPQFLSIIRQAKKARIYTTTSTNAHFIDKSKAEEIVLSGLDRLIISVDGLTQETYEQYRVHGKLEQVLTASKLLVEAKSKLKSNTPFLIFQFLAVRPNEHEIPHIFDLGRAIGIDEVRIKTAQLYEFKNGNPLMPEDQKYSRYVKQKDGTYRIKGNPGNHCWRMWSGSVLTWDGKVVPCCFDKDAKHVLGSIQESSFEEIWSSEKYKSFRKAVINNRQQIDICKNCSEGTQVWG
jgi:radical SAM protein with 4Fe4S-binding SPASM domain